MIEHPDEPQHLSQDVRRPQTRRALNIIGAALVVITVAILVHGLLTPAASAPANNAKPGAAAPLIGHYAPDITLLDLANNKVTLSSLRGKVVVLNFWYVACQPCRYEMPALEKAYERDNGAGLVVVGVDVVDDAQTASTFVQQLGVTYLIWRDVGQHAVFTYRVTDTPSTFFIDRNGVIRAKVVGPLDTATLSKDTASLLSKS